MPTGRSAFRRRSCPSLKVLGCVLVWSLVNDNQQGRYSMRLRRYVLSVATVVVALTIGGHADVVGVPSPKQPASTPQIYNLVWYDTHYSDRPWAVEHTNTAR